MDKVDRKQKINRRVAFRIYEQVNIFYSKIDQSRVSDAYSAFNRSNHYSVKPIENSSANLQARNVEQQISDSRAVASNANEHDTLNVNISTSGIAFTCEDIFKAGDYLLIRLELPAAKAVIETCCRVVYCKNSNPYENQYPFLVGAEFINMQEEDAALLASHVHKRKKQQLVLNGLMGAAVLTVLAIPEVLWHLWLALLHYLFEVFLHLIHLAFEWVELSIDVTIEHAFHTSLRQTQILTFYILFSLGLLIMYLLWRLLPPICQRCKRNQIAYWSRKKASVLYYWGEQTDINKIKIVVLGVSAIAGYSYFF